MRTRQNGTGRPGDAAQPVAEQEADTPDRALPERDTLHEGKQLRQRPDEMRRDARHQQVALDRALPGNRQVA